jgi:hypothetical protein
MLGATWRLLIWPYDVYPIITRPGFMSTPSFSPFSVVFSNQRFRNCSFTVDVGFVKLSSDWVRKMNIEFWCHLCCSSSVILDTILFNVQQSIPMRFGFRPLVLVADDVFLWFVCTVITMETAAMDTPNKVAVLVTYAPAIRRLKIWHVSHFAVLSYELLLYTVCNALTLALRDVNKQKNDDRYSQLMFSQCSQHTQFYSYSI